MSKSPTFKSSSFEVPSRRMTELRSVIDDQLVAMKRLITIPPHELVERYGITLEQVFARGDGICVMAFGSGAILSFASDVERWSVIVSVAYRSDGEPAGDQAKLYTIDVNDAQYTSRRLRDMVGSQLKRIELLRPKSPPAAAVGRPCEVGLLMEFYACPPVVVGHQIGLGANDLQILLADELSEEISTAIEVEPFLP